VGIYGVLKPHLLAVYEEHRGQANPVYEPPTCRILERCIEDERRHVAAGHTIIAHLTATPESQSRVAAWQAMLQRLLEAAHGVTGAGLPPVTARPSGEVPLSDDAREFISLERAGLMWAIPEDLETAIRAFGDALVAGDRAGLRGFLDTDPDAALIDALEEGGLVRHTLVAFAKLGRHRIVKYRLGGQSRTATVNARWEQSERGWRVGAVDLIKIEQSQPA